MPRAKHPCLFGFEGEKRLDFHDVRLNLKVTTNQVECT
jgi:hypothetical protein